MLKFWFILSLLVIVCKIQCETLKKNDSTNVLVAPISSETVDLEVSALITRLIGKKSSLFQVYIQRALSDKGLDAFQIFDPSKTIQATVRQRSVNRSSKYPLYLTLESNIDSWIQRIKINNKPKIFLGKTNSKTFSSVINVMEITKTKESNLVQIIGSSRVAAAWGFHYYLKEYCDCHISWDGDQLFLPEELPEAQIIVKANDKYRYYQNVVTTSYSFVWWNWTRWEREIDWMALNGINLALSFNGQEEIWRRVYNQLGLNDTEIDEHFTGPAFLSWNRMGNVRGWLGPLSKSWHTKSVKLQKQILQRMRALEIQPVHPAFAGLVPQALKRIYPEANLTVVEWLNFQPRYCCVYYLSPLDKLFGEIGSKFLNEYIKEFGTDHIYNCDSFNEMTPPRGDIPFIRSTGEAIYNSLVNVDKDAIWMMQGWLFANQENFWTLERSKALLTSVPTGKMIILDLKAEKQPQYARLNNFFGQPFIWCMLHNFGGVLGMQGDMNSINTNIFKARSTDGSTMIGTGMTPEGINQNYVVYDLFLEMGYRKEPVDLIKWSQNYARRRYKNTKEDIDKSWMLLMKSVYNYAQPEQMHGEYIFVMRPQLSLKELVWYDKEDVWQAWGHLVSAANDVYNCNTTTFKYDLVDVTRQSLQLCLDKTYQEIQAAYSGRNIDKFKNKVETFMELLDDVDSILETLPHFLLGRWIEDAKEQGETPLEKQLFERNARNQITLWGPTGEIVDYARKQWAGLVKDYYSPRWKIFWDAALEALDNGTDINQDKVNQLMFSKVEEAFTYSTKTYCTHPKES